MIQELATVAHKCVDEMKGNKKMVMTGSDWNNYKTCKTCHICNKQFKPKDVKVRDHDHETGAYRGVAHNKCNINYFSNRYLPVVFHNLKGYDSHLIIKEAYKLNSGNISVIPNNFEKFMSFKIGDLKFLDSFQFLSSSLEQLGKIYMMRQISLNILII